MYTPVKLHLLNALLWFAALSCNGNALRSGRDGGVNDLSISGFDGVGWKDTAFVEPDGQTNSVQPTVLATNQDFPAAIAVGVSGVYWFNLGENISNDPLRAPQPWTHGQIMKCALGDCGGAPTPLVFGRVSARTVISPVFLLDEMDVYWSDATSNVQDVEGSEQLFRCPLDGCANDPESLVVGQVLAASIDASNLYWTTASLEIDYRPLSVSVLWRTIRQ